MASKQANRNRRGGRGMHKQPAEMRQSVGTKRNTGRIPAYLEPAEITALISHAENSRARLAMRLQWRAGLRIAEAVAVIRSDVHLNADPPELLVRAGKGNKDRLVPLHPELAAALENYIDASDRRADDPLIGVTRQHAWRWYKSALRHAYDAGEIPRGKPCATHTLRHSAARHWLKNGTPINVVSQWLGHTNLQTTLVYLKLAADPGGFMERVP